MIDRHALIPRWRAARRILDHLSLRPVPDHPQEHINSLACSVDLQQYLMRHWTTCQQRGWDVASQSVVQRIRRLTEDIRVAADNLDRHLQECNNRRPTFRNLIDELEQLEQEFAGARYTSNEVSVVTEPIYLDGLALGRFEVQLQFETLADSGNHHAYRVLALEPNPAVSDDSVTHPHIQETILCEGDAAPAIRQALADGRICDLFILVRSVLQAYNPYSAYITTDDWGGVTCPGCDDLIGYDGTYCCTDCDADRCIDCIVYCKTCDESFCSGCVSSCSGCEALLCDRCMQICPGCDESNCDECLKSDHHHDEEQCDDEPSEASETVGAPGSADAAVCA